DPVNVLQYIRNSFEQLYKTEGIDREAVEELTRSLPQVSSAQNAQLVKKISEEEILDVIGALANNKSPETDGLSYEFYKLAKEEVIPILQKLFNRVLETGEMPTSWSQNIITLIPKKKENLETISNWRPISLTNCDVKIFMKIIANRLNVICADVIGSYKRGFVTGRSIL